MVWFGCLVCGVNLFVCWVIYFAANYWLAFCLRDACVCFVWYLIVCDCDCGCFGGLVVLSCLWLWSYLVYFACGLCFGVLGFWFVWWFTFASNFVIDCLYFLFVILIWMFVGWLVCVYYRPVSYCLFEWCFKFALGRLGYCLNYDLVCWVMFWVVWFGIWCVFGFDLVCYDAILIVL